MSFPGLQPPPPFLSSPGHPDIPWEQWIQAFRKYVVASGDSDLHAMSHEAILLNCLGLEEKHVFPTQTSDDHPFLEVAAAGQPLTSPVPDDST
ncbi:hypothetical protein HPB50_002042 [Hyalomma asiaticum]|uniref:Uncharacterized protein n=1 Tax=Hyalomma asiaticum TaxID=266040 RepID=A0ACB7TFI0_HYAAI|nr:hypothetical protein HPB50_002042 [Hyalomma asiaticum]